MFIYRYILYLPIYNYVYIFTILLIEMLVDSMIFKMIVVKKINLANRGNMCYAFILESLSCMWRPQILVWESLFCYVMICSTVAKIQSFSKKNAPEIGPYQPETEKLPTYIFEAQIYNKSLLRAEFAQKHLVEGSPDKP